MVALFETGHFLLFQRLRKIGDESVRKGKEQLTQNVELASLHLTTALVVLKALHMIKMFSNWQLGEVFLLKAEANYHVALSVENDVSVHDCGLQFLPLITEDVNHASELNFSIDSHC